MRLNNNQISGFGFSLFTSQDITGVEYGDEQTVLPRHILSSLSVVYFFSLITDHVLFV